MADGKDIAWTQYAWCGGALVAGLAIGIAICNTDAYKKWQAKREAKKNAKKTDSTKKS